MQLDYELELIGQLGDWHGRDHSAFAGHAELGYTLDLPWSPRLVGQFDYASGTADPSGDESHHLRLPFRGEALRGDRSDKRAFPQWFFGSDNWTSVK